MLERLGLKKRTDSDPNSHRELTDIGRTLGLFQALSIVSTESSEFIKSLSPDQIKAIKKFSTDLKMKILDAIEKKIESDPKTHLKD